MSSVISLGDLSQHVDLTTNRTLRTRREQQSVRVRPDYRASCMWVSLTDSSPCYFTNEVLNDLQRICSAIRGLQTTPFRFRVLRSDHDRVFSLGGDLRLFRDCIQEQRVEVIEQYARASIAAIWESITGSGYPDLTSIALVQGEAQGGGFEAALASHVLVAEENARFGFPESLFGLFPGMGAKELLEARAPRSVAKTLVSTARRYTASELHKLGIIDYVVPVGQGDRFVRDVILNLPTEILAARRARFAAISKLELLQSVDRWVETAMLLGRKSQRAMCYLIDAQERIFSEVRRSRGSIARAELLQ